MAFILCENCLETDGAKVTLGPELGSQRDPFRDTIVLCPDCSKALLSHDLFTFTGRFTTTRTIHNTRKL
jgi:hypothetical protein